MVAQETMPQRISMGMNLTGRVEKRGDTYYSMCNELPLVGNANRHLLSVR